MLPHSSVAKLVNIGHIGRTGVVGTVKLGD